MRNGCSARGHVRQNARGFLTGFECVSYTLICDVVYRVHLHSETPALRSEPCPLKVLSYGLFLRDPPGTLSFNNSFFCRHRFLSFLADNVFQRRHFLLPSLRFESELLFCFLSFGPLAAPLLLPLRHLLFQLLNPLFVA